MGNQHPRRALLDRFDDQHMARRNGLIGAVTIRWSSLCRSKQVHKSMYRYRIDPITIMRKVAILVSASKTSCPMCQIEVYLWGRYCILKEKLHSPLATAIVKIHRFVLLYLGLQLLLAYKFIHPFGKREFPLWWTDRSKFVDLRIGV